jgi:hypothetical protein
MKALRDPVLERYGWNYLPYFTDEFAELVEKALDKILQFSDEKVSYYTTYFKVRGEDVSSEFDCCGDEKCIKEAKKEIRKQYGKGTHIEECCYENDGDHDSIERCSVCGTPLNEWLTWCEQELEYIEESKPWSAENLRSEAFTIRCILQSCPTMDYNISTWVICNRLEEALEEREAFFQRIGELAQSVLNTDLTNPINLNESK